MTPLSSSSSSCPPSPSSSHHFIPHPLPPSSIAGCYWRRSLGNCFRGCQSIWSRHRLESATGSCSSPSPLFSPLLLLLFFKPLRQKKKKKAKKPLYRVGWRHWEVLMFPQREACDWFSETSVTASWSLIGEESWAAINMDEGAMKGPM